MSGAPSVPILTGSSSSSHLYSYDLLWEVHSQYTIKHHEAVFWPSSKVRITELFAKQKRNEIFALFFLYEIYPKAWSDRVLSFCLFLCKCSSKTPSKCKHKSHLQDVINNVPPKNSQSKRIPSLPKSEEYTYNLKGLQNNTYYDVVLRAENKFGWSPYSKVFTFQTLEKDKATMKLQDQQIIPLFEGQGKKVLSCFMNKQTRIFKSSNNSKNNHLNIFGIEKYVFFGPETFYYSEFSTTHPSLLYHVYISELSD